MGHWPNNCQAFSKVKPNHSYTRQQSLDVARLNCIMTVLKCANESVERNRIMPHNNFGKRHMQNTPCTLRTAGSLYFQSVPEITSTHLTTVLLYFSLAGTWKENTLPILLVVISVAFMCANSSVTSESLTVQPIVPEVALQLNVAVDPRVALTDVGVLTKAEIRNVRQNQNTIINFMCGMHSTHAQ